ncbi:XK-related protein 9 isoform X1 [Mixophyes fleayi]|uniref:XK-related protein 9 isoform X1 n=1 Tax=Mixophyes fleayi TaxID=3061075 RepID=UPI003F4DD25B
MSFTKWNFFMTVFGIFTFLFDIGADLLLSFKFFQQELYLFSLLTIFFVLVSTLIVQAFSYTWFKDDCDEGSYGRLKWVLVVHLFQAGTLLRYWYAVKYGYKATYDPRRENHADTKKKAVETMTDLSMLRCFKTYLESAPQLILQLYVLMEHGQITVMQYASILISVCSISWSTVDYQMSLRKSLPGKKGISVGFPMFSYVFYKLFTLTSWILSIVFLLTCNHHIFTILVTVLGIVGFCWAWIQKTDFCRTKRMEILYRAIVGIILIFTFFNVKGSRTRIPMSVYYIVRVLTTAGILILCLHLKPPFVLTFIFAVLSIVAIVALGFGILFLILYYACFHPSLSSIDRTLGDTVDSPTCMDRSRITHFMIP